MARPFATRVRADNSLSNFWHLLFIHYDYSPKFPFMICFHNLTADPVTRNRQATLAGGYALPVLTDKVLRLATPALLEAVIRVM